MKYVVLCGFWMPAKRWLWDRYKHYRKRWSISPAAGEVWLYIKQLTSHLTEDTVPLCYIENPVSALNEIVGS